MNENKYVVTNGNYYCILSDKNAVTKTENLEMATVFSDEDALKILKRATKKLKGYKKIPCARIMPEASESQYLEKTEEKEPEQETEEKTASRKKISLTQREQVYTASEGRCKICGSFVRHDEFTVDHIIPVAKGGESVLSNYQTACRCCNQIKQDFSEDEMIQKISGILLYQMEQKGFGKRKKMKIKKITEELCRKTAG